MDLVINISMLHFSFHSDTNMIWTVRWLFNIKMLLQYETKLQLSSEFIVKFILEQIWKKMFSITEMVEQGTDSY